MRERPRRKPRFGRGCEKRRFVGGRLPVVCHSSRPILQLRVYCICRARSKHERCYASPAYRPARRHCAPSAGRQAGRQPGTQVRWCTRRARTPSTRKEKKSENGNSPHAAARVCAAHARDGRDDPREGRVPLSFFSHTLSGERAPGSPRREPNARVLFTGTAAQGASRRRCDGTRRARVRPCGGGGISLLSPASTDVSRSSDTYHPPARPIYLPARPPTRPAGRYRFYRIRSVYSRFSYRRRYRRPPTAHLRPRENR